MTNAVGDLNDAADNMERTLEEMERATRLMAEQREALATAWKERDALLVAAQALMDLPLAASDFERADAYRKMREAIAKAEAGRGEG